MTENAISPRKKAIKDPSPQRRARINEVLAYRQCDLTIVLANIHDEHNVSAIYRSCDAFGVAKVYLYYTNTNFPSLGKKTSASASKWVETEKINDKNILFKTLHDSGHQILATSCSKKAKPLNTWDFTKPSAIILGNEHSGVDEELVDIVDGELYIPMRGMIQSFNVSVAAAIILAEAARQREQAKMYDKISYSQEEYDAKVVLWLQK